MGSLSLSLWKIYLSSIEYTFAIMSSSDCKLSVVIEIGCRN